MYFPFLERVRVKFPIAGNRSYNLPKVPPHFFPPEKAKLYCSARSMITMKVFGATNQVFGGLSQLHV